MADWDWCTFLLLIVLSLIVIALLVGGTCATMTYFRMAERYHNQNKHPAYKSYSLRPSSSGYMSVGSPERQRKPQLPYSSSQPPLQNRQQQDLNSPHLSPNTSPAMANSAYGQPTPEQQQLALAQYWQMMYYQYMQQIMSAAKDAQYEKQPRTDKQ